MKKEYIYITLILIAVLFIRFNRQDLFISGIIGEIGGDHHQYYKMVEFFRGEAKFSDADIPFSTRLVTPMIASVLPFERGFALNLTNALLLWLGFILSLHSLKQFVIDDKWKFYVVALHIVCFPVFYYSVIGFIDASLVGWMMICIYLFMRKKFWAYSIMLGIGIFVKETVVILFGASFIYFLIQKEYKKTVYLTLIYGAFYILHGQVIQYLNYGNPNNYAWKPEMAAIMTNIYRPRTYLSFLLSSYPSVINLFVSAYLYFKKRYSTDNIQLIRFAMSGIALSMMVHIYSFFTAYTDGRFLLLALPFSIILLAINIEEYYKRRAKTQLAN